MAVLYRAYTHPVFSFIFRLVQWCRTMAWNLRSDLHLIFKLKPVLSHCDPIFLNRSLFLFFGRQQYGIWGHVVPSQVYTGKDGDFKSATDTLYSVHCTVYTQPKEQVHPNVIVVLASVRLSLKPVAANLQNCPLSFSSLHFGKHNLPP